MLVPASGAWSATLRLGDPQERAWNEGDLVTVRWLGQACEGAIESRSEMEGKTTLFVVGGQGKLQREVAPKHYQSASPSVLLQDLCSAAGEQADVSRIPRPVKLFVFPRRRARAAEILEDLSRAAELPWSVTLAGKVALGSPTWAPMPDFDHDELDADSVYQTSELTLRDVFGPVPGQTYKGRRVGCARYTQDEHGALCRLWFCADLRDIEADPLRLGIVDVIRQTVPLTWLGKYPGKVRAVRSDGTWDIDLEEKRMPTFVGVRPRVFCPGARIVPPVGSVVELSFEQADMRYPVAELCAPGDAQRGIARLNDTVDLWYTTAADPDGGTFVTAISATAGAFKVQLKISSASDRAFLP